jgi:hypothetical protein
VTRYKKGESGNRAGRPPGRHREAPYEAVLGQMVNIRKDGIERLVTAEEAFLLKLKGLALKVDSAVTRAASAMIGEVKEYLRTSQLPPVVIVRQIVDPGSVTLALEPLRMAKKLDPYRETARMALEPWLVEAALARLPHPLSPADQRIIVKATRTPHKVRWPAWFTERP